MRASLKPHPSDFGNKDYDKLYFQFDVNRARYLRGKDKTLKSRYGLIEPNLRLHKAVVSWCRKKLQSEHQSYWGGVQDYETLSSRVQEDFAVITGDDQVVAVYFSFPSNWAPEKLLGLSFSEVHHPVPNFPRSAKESIAMVKAMVNKGPYVRFVWTVSPDSHLDHHPEYGVFGSWDSPNAGYLRVERQITVPFPAENGALFLVRTYLTPFSRLSPSQNATLVKALSSLPECVASYKGLSQSVVDKAINLLKVMVI